MSYKEVKTGIKTTSNKRYWVALNRYHSTFWDNGIKKRGTTNLKDVSRRDRVILFFKNYEL